MTLYVATNDRPIFATIIKVAWVAGLSAVIKNGLTLEDLENIEKAAKQGVIKSYEAVKQQARIDEEGN